MIKTFDCDDCDDLSFQPDLCDPYLRSHGLDFWWQWGWVGGDAVTLSVPGVSPNLKVLGLDQYDGDRDNVMALQWWGCGSMKYVLSSVVWLHDVKTYQLEQQQLRKSELETANNDQHEFFK